MIFVSASGSSSSTSKVLAPNRCTRRLAVAEDKLAAASAQLIDCPLDMVEAALDDLVGRGAVRREKVARGPGILLPNHAQAPVDRLRLPSAKLTQPLRGAPPGRGQQGRTAH